MTIANPKPQQKKRGEKWWIINAKRRERKVETKFVEKETVGIEKIKENPLSTFFRIPKFAMQRP